jgi:outer membrane protein OmpA-like peptidoglycan-associated protein
MNRRRNELQRRVALAAMLAALGVAFSGCQADGGSPFGLVATEEWVRNYIREQNAPIQSKLAQVDERVTKVDARVTQVATQTAEARQVADDGVRKADGVNGRLTQALADREKRTQVESTALPFATGKYTLQPEHRKLLDYVHEKLKNNPTYTADIVGEADGQGAKQDNSMLSWRRTEHVRRYLTDKGDVLRRIAFIGMGEDRTDTGKAQEQHRQVLVVIYRPVAE